MINGKPKSKEQLQDIEDDYEEYTQLNGNSYVHDLHEIWLRREDRLWVQK